MQIMWNVTWRIVIRLSVVFAREFIMIRLGSLERRIIRSSEEV